MEGDLVGGDGVVPHHGVHGGSEEEWFVRLPGPHYARLGGSGVD